ncbi:MAG: nickel ABC transporter permease [Terrisporobacter sp.]|uniref:nickel ABC transporter permease n=1 Tax=Terrisporobacter TaxID=1505652 RepID=UPI00280A7EF8|nr:nickel ABC transporter permease [Terrisporobacter othiniensis]MDU2201062.1 ABC transporter permease [Terrisporobacter othiniensis]
MRNIIKKIIKRILGTIPMLIIVSFISFALMNLSSGDPAEIMLSSQGSVVTPQLLESVREDMGLNQPFVTQYLNWLKNIIHGDFGTSYASGRSVIVEMNEHLPYTIKLAGSAMIITLIVSIPLGILSAVKKDKFIDKFIRLFTFVGNSIPGFLLALILLLVFSLKLKLLPILSESGAKSIILPSVTLAFAMTSKYIRQIRTAVIEELDKGYVKGARSRGIKESVILYKDVLKNIMITVITLTGLSIGSLMGGTAVVESIFVWPGVGSLALSAIANRDYPIIQAYVLWMAVMFIIINLITDLLYKIIDPRVREV